MPPRYCPDCGGVLTPTVLSSDGRNRFKCQRCDKIRYQGPSVGVLTLIFAEDCLLLIRRGTPPYPGKWAPPGGFVEQDESLETAAIREVQEEVGIQLRRESLLPHALHSLPQIQQICVVFLARLEQRVASSANAPEVAEANWFTQQNYPSEHIWDPGVSFNINHLYEQVREGRFDFYQESDDFFRVISTGTSLRYLRKGRLR